VSDTFDWIDTQTAFLAASREDEIVSQFVAEALCAVAGPSDGRLGDIKLWIDVGSGYSRKVVRIREALGARGFKPRRVVQVDPIYNASGRPVEEDELPSDIEFVATSIGAAQNLVNQESKASTCLVTCFHVLYEKETASQLIEFMGAFQPHSSVIMLAICESLTSPLQAIRELLRGAGLTVPSPQIEYVYNAMNNKNRWTCYRKEGPNINLPVRSATGELVEWLPAFIFGKAEARVTADEQKALDRAMRVSSLISKRTVRLESTFLSAIRE
jgi:hypothetical protein